MNAVFTRSDSKRRAKASALRAAAHLMFVCGAASACNSAPSDDRPAPLIDHDAWEISSASDDPFATMHEYRVRCDVSALSWEADGFEVSTETCGHLTVQQRTGADVEEGETLDLDLSWGPLIAEVPTEAVIEIRIGDATLFNETLSVPAAAGIRTVSLIAPISAPRGTMVYFHVRNHGSNSYKLRSLAKAR